MSILSEKLKRCTVCVFETDTVVGIGTPLFFQDMKTANSEGINKIFEIKNRPLSKPLPWLISSTKMLNDYVTDIPKWAQSYPGKFWPGNTTLVLPVTDTVNHSLTLNNSVAFRIPQSEYLINVIDTVGCPILTTSANFSGLPPCKKIEELPSDFVSLVDFVDNTNINTTKKTQPSQIIDCTGSSPKIVRS